MCNPILLAITTAAFSVGSSYVAYQGQKQQAEAAQQAANLNAAQQNNVLSQKSSQTESQASEKNFEDTIQGVRKEGMIVASASERGLDATSATQLTGVNAFEVGRVHSIEEANLQDQRQQLSNEGTGIELTRESTIAANQGPNPLSLALGIGSGVLSGFGAYNTYSNPGKKT